MPFKKERVKSEISQSLERKKRELDLSTNDENFKVSFHHLDTSQRSGSTFRDWQNDKLLSHAMDVLQGYCCRPLKSQFDKKFTVYGAFPEPEYTKFKCPDYIPEDANWARIHINGLAILAGHIVGNTFYLVFLDKHHNFYLTKKARERS